MYIYSIYKATNIITGKCYIGFDSNWPARKTKHLFDVVNPNSKSYNCNFYRALRKYGIENFTWEILYQSLDGPHCLNTMESHFISEYNSFQKGYNMTKGGEGTLGKQSWLGRKHSEETKLKMSMRQKGKIRSKEHSANISKAKKGVKLGPRKINDRSELNI